MVKTVWVLGANGRLGRAVAQAFAAAGWRVFAPWRHGPVADAPVLSGVQWLAPGAATQAALAQGADAVVHTMNPARYTAAAWRAEAPVLLRSAIETALALRAVLLFPGNVQLRRGHAAPARCAYAPAPHHAAGRGARGA